MRQGFPPPRVALVVPALNEAPVIGDVVRGLLSSFTFVIVVDDGSSDATARTAREAGAQVVRHVVNLGQGAALSTGVLAALRVPSVEWIITFDADGQHRPQDAAALLDRAVDDDLDITLGTRFGSAKVEAGPAKRLTLKAAVTYTRLTTGLPLTDTHNGLRAMKRGFAESLHLRVRGMGHASEILHHVANSGARWAEVPVRIHYTPYSRSKGQPLINSVNIVFEHWLR